MQPESSDGFASVGTILPEEGAALLPGGSFRFCSQISSPTQTRAAASNSQIASAPLPPRNPTVQSGEEAEVAQLVEQLIRNQQVVGSSPTFGSILFLPALPPA